VLAHFAYADPPVMTAGVREPKSSVPEAKSAEQRSRTCRMAGLEDIEPRQIISICGVLGVTVQVPELFAL
jgi:hypothetical protein